ncbi:LacI family transcriptional regulator [uncultured Tateyamaria sp.]|uniref:LacI family transcriptional regulator n=1 Tax=uncultured Tateyamaria sp. TaxID=455651 RepID=UPI00261BCB6C|nr:LacI family transcriptional regulator [uncultured Tateyamaria sp.]
MANDKPKPPTLKTIADLTGLSLSTVSLSLRDGSRLKKETREKIAQAAAEVGYVPNRAGVRLRTGQTNVLSLVLSPARNTIDYTRQIIEGIGAHLMGTKYHLNVIPDFQHDTPEDSVRYILQNRAADGIILTHTSARDPRVQMLMDTGFPFVSHGRTEFYGAHAFHDFHAERFVQMAVSRLLDLKRKRFLLVAEDDGTTNFSKIVGGFHRALAQSGMTGEVATETGILVSTQTARTFGQALAGRADPFDAIISNNELATLALMGGLSDSGMVEGRDYSLICRQTTDILPILHPGIDTVGEDLSQTGRELARLLIARVQGAPIETLQTLHEPKPLWRAQA